MRESPASWCWGGGSEFGGKGSYPRDLGGNISKVIMKKRELSNSSLSISATLKKGERVGAQN